MVLLDIPFRKHI